MRVLLSLKELRLLISLLKAELKSNYRLRIRNQNSKLFKKVDIQRDIDSQEYLLEKLYTLQFKMIKGLEKKSNP